MNNKIKSFFFALNVHIRSYKFIYSLSVALFVMFMLLLIVAYFSELDPNNSKLAICVHSVATYAGIITIMSIIITIATLQKTQSLFEAQMLKEYDTIYSSEKMCDDLRNIKMFSKDHSSIFNEGRDSSDNPAGGFKYKKNNHLRWPKQIDQARRNIKFYFINPLDLYKEGKISKSIFLRIIDKTGIIILFDVVEKMEFLINESYDHHKFYEIMLLAEPIYTRQKKSDEVLSTAKSIRRVDDMLPWPPKK